VTNQGKINAIKHLRGSRLRHPDFSGKSLGINRAARFIHRFPDATPAPKQRSRQAFAGRSVLFFAREAAPCTSSALPSI